MEWLKHMNAALAYMEDNIAGEISLKSAAQLACMSEYQFYRIFSFIAGMPLAEYLRRRRLTMAAYNLQSGEKVIDVAHRYGYESPTAFNRAFKSIHGIAPSAARKPNVTLKAFPRICFQITIKGVEEMDYRIVQKEAFRIVGTRVPLEIGLDYKKTDNLSITDDAVKAAFSSVPKFYNELAQNGKMAQIAQMISKEPMGLLGVTFCRDDGQSYYYVAASTDMPVPEGMYEEKIEAGTWAVFSGSGEPSSIQGLMEKIYAEWLPSSGYEWKNGPDIEVYLNDDPVNMEYEVWLPVTGKA